MTSENETPRPAGAAPEPVPWRVQGAIYGIGLFSTTQFFMSAVVVPLWVATLTSSPLVVGLVLAARQFLPLFLSIHAGVLMDRLGARRVIIALSVPAIAVPVLFPAMPWLGAALVLQLIGGLSDSMGWLGAQTMIGQHMKGHTRYTGRLSFIIRFGHLGGPPLIGALWDLFGPWGAFAAMSLWGVGMLGCAAMLPPGRGRPAGGRGPARGGRMGRLLPNPADYLSAFRMLALPTIAAAVMTGMMLHMGNSLQSTFYVVYLGGIGVSGTSIGVLFAAFAVCAAGGSLLAARLSRHVRPFWLLLGSVWASMVLIAVTPALGTFALLLVAMALRGASNGVGQPLIISIVLGGADAANQGKAIGLRATANRLAAITSPVLVGVLAEWFGIAASFYAVGALVTVLIAGIALYVRRRPDVTRRGRDG